jgi:hypothetical protein
MNSLIASNRKFFKHYATPVFDAIATAIPLLAGQPELVPVALGATHAGLEVMKPLAVSAMGKNTKRYAKLEAQRKAQEVVDEPKPTYYTSPYQTAQPRPSTAPTYSYGNNISSNTNMPYRKYSAGSGLHAPRSRGCGFDSISPISRATLGHAEANSMLGKMESHMAQARQHNQGLVGVSGNLINQIAPLQSQPQQNFQFRHTLITPAYRPTVYGQ